MGLGLPNIYFFPSMSLPVRKMFDSISRRYDFLNRLLSAGRDVAWRKKAARLVGARQSLRVLDLCGGTGDFLHAMQKAGHRPSLEVIADFSLPMLMLARKKYGVHCIQMDALAPALRAASFDVVLCGYGMRNLDSLPKGLQEIRELLKPGGEFVTLEFFRPQGIFARFFYGILAPMAIPVVGRLFSGNRTAYDYLVDSVKRYKTVDEYVLEEKAQGFKPSRIIACDGGISHIVMAGLADKG